MKQGYLRIRTDEPDYSDLPDKHYTWERSVYGDVHEQIPRDAPKALGKPVVLTTYVDANLNHDLVTGRSVSGVLHFVNQTPVYWFSKKQPTVETATYGSEFIAAKLAVEQIMAMRLTLRYLGVEIKGSTRLFGDNGSVVTSASVPDSPLRKRHQSLAYHYTREAIAAGAVDFRHIPGHLNPADILSKHWGYQQVWPMLRTIMFWTGNPSEILLESTPQNRRGAIKFPLWRRTSQVPRLHRLTPHPFPRILPTRYLEESSLLTKRDSRRRIKIGKTQLTYPIRPGRCRRKAKYESQEDITVLSRYSHLTDGQTRSVTETSTETQQTCTVGPT